MKKDFCEPALEIQAFWVEDIIATSTVTDDWDTNNYAFTDENG